MSLDVVNGMSDDALRMQLLQCCGSVRWADAVIMRRPWATGGGLLEAADAAFDGLPDDAWLEALRAEASPEAVGGDDGARAAAATAMELYARQFGWPFVSPTPREPAEPLLMRVRIRLGNEPAAAQRAARDELRRAARTRLQRLLEDSGAQRA
ncbi:MAG TPA: 2-oxo-4-hydroxy-4-carboxy-5-ureidoimidazoline decarboxylase [Longimicrobiales bacterium]|nr:2-oxo-4-hydroxy-4-carboxy-5-ureidoimidazoline decarboxylase [Longimicrobiales bacterium]